MNNRPTTLERAFQLAGSGQHKSIEDIKMALKQEGFDLTQVTGRTLFEQLRATIKQASNRKDA